MQVAEEILRYFLRNPQAIDDLEGVARWRLLDERIHSSLGEVSRAIAWLVSEGLLLQQGSDTANSLFRLNADRRSDSERLCEGTDPEGTKPPTEKP